MTPDINTLWDLLERVRKAEGPDRMLDRLLCVHLAVAPWAGQDVDTINYCMIGSKMDKATPALTSSLDAVAALVERRLPSFEWCVNRDGAHMGDVVYFADVWNVSVREHAPDVIRSNPALALLSALLQALIARAQQSTAIDGMVHISEDMKLP